MKLKGFIKRIDIYQPSVESYEYGSTFIDHIPSGPPEATVELIFTGDNLSELIETIKMNEEIELDLEPVVVKTVGKPKKVNKWRLIRL